MKKHVLECPNCGLGLVKSYGTEAKMRVKLLKWDRNGIFAVCKGCGSDVSIGVDLIKSLQSLFVYEVETSCVAKNKVSK